MFSVGQLNSKITRNADPMSGKCGEKKACAGAGTLTKNPLMPLHKTRRATNWEVLFVSVASLSLLVMEQTKCVVFSDVVACGCALLWSVVCGCVGGEMSKKKYLENELGVPSDCSPWFFTQKKKHNYCVSLGHLLVSISLQQKEVPQHCVYSATATCRVTRR